MANCLRDVMHKFSALVAYSGSDMLSGKVRFERLANLLESSIPAAYGEIHRGNHSCAARLVFWKCIYIYIL